MIALSKVVVYPISVPVYYNLTQKSHGLSLQTTQGKVKSFVSKMMSNFQPRHLATQGLRK